MAELISKHSKSATQQSELAQRSEPQLQKSEILPSVDQSEVQETHKSEVQEGAVVEVASHISNVASHISNPHHAKSMKSSNKSRLGSQVQSVEPTAAQQEIDELQNELASNKTTEIQSLSKQFVQ